MLAPGEPVKLLRRTVSGYDAHDRPIYSSTEVDLPLALFDPGGARVDAEPREPGRSPAVVEPTLYWRDARPAVTETDRVRVRGEVYEVVGVPSDWRGATVGGLVARLRLVKEGEAGG